jgi:hypothetical protein
MKVYITYCSDGYNGEMVDEVFSTMEKACEYIIKHYFNSSFYSKLSKEQKLKAAEEHITVHDVI